METIERTAIIRTPLQAGDQPDGAGEAGGRVQADHQPD